MIKITLRPSINYVITPSPHVRVRKIVVVRKIAIGSAEVEAKMATLSTLTPRMRTAFNCQQQMQTGKKTQKGMNMAAGRKD